MRDLDLLAEIHGNAKAVVQVTLTTYDEALCRILEPHVCTTARRVQVLEACRERGIPTVVWLSPILPFLNDTEENLMGLLRCCAQAGVKRIICFGMGLTLREGNRAYFYRQLDRHFPGLSDRYRRCYGNAYEVLSPNGANLMGLFACVLPGAEYLCQFAGKFPLFASLSRRNGRKSSKTLVEEVRSFPRGGERRMKRLLVYLKAYRKECVLGPLFKLLEALFELFVPLVMTAIIDVGISSGDHRYILERCGLLALLAVVGLVCSITAQYFAAKAATGFSARLRSALFAHVQGLSYREIDTLGTATMITRMTSDVNQLQNGVNLALRLLLRSPFVVFGAMVMAFTIDVSGALVFAVAIPVLLAVVFAIILVTIPMYRKVQSHLDGVTAPPGRISPGCGSCGHFGRNRRRLRNFPDEINC